MAGRLAKAAHGAVLWLWVFSVLALAPMTALAAPYAAIVVDARTGQVLYSHNADARLHPASLTKMLTLYIAFDAIRRGEITLDTMVTVSRNAAAEPPSKLGLRAGQRISIRHLIRAAAVRSANDAATAIGEAISGTEEAFARRMTNTAKALGMANSTFRNAHGLTASGHLSTARDMNLLGRRLFYDFPQYYNLFSRITADAGVTQVANTNRRFLQAYRGADGIKTGYTNAAGFNLTASAERGDKRIIATVFGGTSTAQRNAKMTELLDMGFGKAPARATVQKPQAVALGAVAAGETITASSEPAGAQNRSSAKTLRLIVAVAKSPRPLPRPGPPEPAAQTLIAINEDVRGVLQDLVDGPASSPDTSIAAADDVPIASPLDTAVAGAIETAMTGIEGQDGVPDVAIAAPEQSRLPRPRPLALAANETAAEPDAAEYASGAVPDTVPVSVAGADGAEDTAVSLVVQNSPVDGPEGELAVAVADDPEQQKVPVQGSDESAEGLQAIETADVVDFDLPGADGADTAAPRSLALLSPEDSIALANRPPLSQEESAAVIAALAASPPAPRPTVETEDATETTSKTDPEAQSPQPIGAVSVALHDADAEGGVDGNPAPGSVSMSAAVLPNVLTVAQRPRARPGEIVMTASGAVSDVTEIASVAPSRPFVVTRLSSSGGRHWGVNLGRFQSRSAAERILLQTALGETAALDGALRKVVARGGGYDANYLGLTREQADLACRRLQARSVQCFTMGPS